MKKIFCIVLVSSLFACSATRQTTNTKNALSESSITEVMHSVFSWQVANPVTGNAAAIDDWARAVFYVGITRAYQQTKDTAYLNQAKKWSEEVNYQLGPRLRHADDHTRGQVFLDIYNETKEDRAIRASRQQFDSIMQQPELYPREQWWCDALFMSPPVWVRLAKATGQPKYNDYINRAWWTVYNFLYDPQEDLFFRDKSFFTKTTSHGKKVFWGRGNGWVMGGLVQMLEYLPKDYADYGRYVDLYKKMAVKIAHLQNADGLWPPSLLDAAEFPNKETSGTSFFVFALAWGINNGLLDKATYKPVVEKGWQALRDAVTAEGQLTYVQKIGSRPEAVQQGDNQEYGSGAFLMAGTEMIKLANKK